MPYAFVFAETQLIELGIAIIVASTDDLGKLLLKRGGRSKKLSADVSSAAGMLLPWPHNAALNTQPEATHARVP
jgi:hypothetical protein